MTRALSTISRGYGQTAESLSIYRILFALWGLVILGPTRMGVGQASAELGGLPDGLYHPPLGPAMILSGWPPAEVILGLEILLAALLVALLIGWRVRLVSILLALVGLVLSCLLFSEGKVDHTILWVVVVPLVMAWSSWGDRWSVDAHPDCDGVSVVPVEVVAMSLGVMFAAAGIIKALTGWLDPGTSSTLGWAFAQDVQAGVPITVPAGFDMIPTAVWAVADYVTVLFELGFFVAALRRSWLVPYLGVAVIFHFAAGMSGFPAFLDIGIVYLLFVRYDGLAARWSSSLLKVERFMRDHRIFVMTAAATVTVVYVASSIMLDGPMTVARMLALLGLPLVYAWPAALMVALVLWWRSRRRRETRPGERMPARFALAGLVLLVVQAVTTVFVSEPYPSLAGPLFMGNFDNGRTINIVRQEFAVDGKPIERTDLFDMPAGAATQIGSARFPAPYLAADGEIIDDPSLLQVLAGQYHQFSARHLGKAAVTLSADERRWFRRNAETAGADCSVGCTLEVSWRRVTIDRATGTVVRDRVVHSQSFDLRP